MYHQLATRFGRNAHQISGREPLNNEALYRSVPSIFAREAHDSRSERYVYVPTIDIVEGLRREGWFPFFAVQSVPRDGSRHGHAKHMLRLRRDEGIGKPEAVEVIIVNSHDGTSAYQMFAGMLRFVCTNSMIAGERFEEVRVPHKGNIQHDIIEGVYTVAEDFPRLIDASETMKEIRLSSDEQRLLADASLVARYGEEESPVRPDQIIAPRRREDSGQSLWTTFNVIQENVIRGGLHGRKQNAEGRIRRSQTRAIVGREALIRWNRPGRGLVYPDTFILVAEQSLLINDIGRWTIRAACEAAINWDENETVAVNLSARQFLDADLVENVRKVLRDTGLRPSRLELEITETALILNKQLAATILHELKALGIKIALDDFGTGYSSMSYVQSFPFDRIKIDRSFVAAMNGDRKSRAIVEAIISLAHSLDIPVVAEGVETEEQATLLRSLLCEELQGFLIARPAPINARGTGQDAIQLAIAADIDLGLEFRLIAERLGDIFDGATNRVAAIQRALRAAKDLDALDVKILKRRRGLVVWHAERCVIQVIADHAVTDWTTCARSAECEDTIAGANLLHLRCAWNQLDQVCAFTNVPVCQGFTTECLDREWHVFQSLRAGLGGGNDDCRLAAHAVIRGRGGLALRICWRYGNGRHGRQHNCTTRVFQACDSRGFLK